MFGTRHLEYNDADKPQINLQATNDVTYLHHEQKAKAVVCSCRVCLCTMLSDSHTAFGSRGLSCSEKRKTCSHRAAT